MNRDQLRAKYPTFKVKCDPDPECARCRGTGERRTRSELRPIVICWCVLFSNPEHAAIAGDIANKVGREGREELERERAALAQAQAEGGE